MDCRKLDAIKKTIAEYKEKKEQERIENPERFEPKYPYELFGIECGKGWEKLYKPILDYAIEHDIGIHQVKEKFGQLRVYLSSYDETVGKMIDDAEEQSEHICEICGKHIDKPIVENHWIYPQCDECHNKSTLEDE